MAKAYLLIDNNQVPKVPIGIFSSDDRARQAAVSGNYLLIPIEINQVHNNIIDDTLPGAFYFDSVVADLAAKLDLFKTQAINQLTSINNKLAQHDTKFDQAQTAFQNLEARVTALEST